MRQLTSSCRRMLDAVVRPFARQKFVLSPSTHRDLRAGPPPATWRSTGPEPTFHLITSRARFPSGWVKLSIDIEITAGDSALGWIHADSGARSDKAGGIRVPRPVDGRVDQIVRLPRQIKALRYDPIKGEGEFTLGKIAVQEIGWLEVFIRQMLRYCKGEKLTPLTTVRAAIAQVRVFGVGGLWTWISEYVNGERPDKSYGPWVTQYDTWTADGLRILETAANGLRRRPKFSIVMPVYNTQERWLRKAIDSVIAQAYDNWELCICDDNSSHAHVTAILDAYRHTDPRIKVILRTENGHIAAATNDAMSLMTGDYMCLMDHDDVLAPHALFEMAKVLDDDPDIDFIYSDEDLITIDDVRCEPFLKPAWSPEYLESWMYIGHFTCFRADIVKRVGGFQSKYDGAQDYDFVLRYTEHSRKNRHIRKVLYHWRILPNSTAASIERKAYVIKAAIRALEDRLHRGGDTGRVIERGLRGWYETIRNVTGNPLVSIIVSSAGLEELERDRATGLIAACIEGIRSKSTHRNHEVIVVDDGLLGEGAFATMPGDVRRIIRPDERSNSAEDLNAAAREAAGTFLVFMNGDIDIRSKDWLEALLRHAQRPGVGAVGAKLLFSDDTLRHAGITFRDGLPHKIRQGYPGTDWGYNGSSSVARNYLAVSGACMMISREAFWEAGGFDPSMTPAYQDIDLCLKMVEHGRRNVYAPAAILYQLGTASRADHPDVADLFRARWRHLTTPDPYYGANLTLDPPTFEFQPTIT